MFYLQGVNWDSGWGKCGNVPAGSRKGRWFMVPWVLGSAVWVCNFMVFLFLHQTFKQEFSLLIHFVLTSACWPNGFSRRWASRKWLQPTWFTPALDTWKRVSHACPALLSVGRRVALPRERCSVWVCCCPGWGRSRSLWSCAGRVFLGFYGSFLLIIRVQLCLMSWKRSRSIKHVFVVSRIPVGPRVCL